MEVDVCNKFINNLAYVATITVFMITNNMFFVFESRNLMELYCWFSSSTPLYGILSLVRVLHNMCITHKLQIYRQFFHSLAFAPHIHRFKFKATSPLHDSTRV
jgi:hypothetical protein